MADDTSTEPVDFPLAIDLKELATPVRSGKVKLEDAPSVWYDLFFTTVHHGSDKGGHYVCYTRDREGTVRAHLLDVEIDSIIYSLTEISRNSGSISTTLTSTLSTPSKS